MRLANEFAIAAPVDTTWELLMDVPRVVPCMPGAELIEAIGGDRWKARIKVRLGPMAMLFEAEVHRESVDEGLRRVRLVTTARELKGRGQAKATIESTVAEIDASRTQVDVVTELILSGKIAQFGRGAVQDVAEELVGRFTVNLGEAINEPAGEGQTGSRAAVAPGASAASGFRILLGALGRRMRRIFSGLRGGPRSREG